VAFSRKLAELFVSMTVDSSKFKAGLKDSQGQAKAWQRKVSGDAKKVSQAFAAMRGVIVAAVAAFAGTGFTKALRNQAELKAQAADTAKFLGLTTEAFSAASFAAEKFGVTQQQLTMLLQRMTRNVSEAAIGIGESRNAFAALGVDVQKLRQLRPDEQFRVIAERLSEIGNQGDRIAVARKIFDSEGAKAALQMAEGFGRAADEAKRLKVTLSEDAADTAVQLRDAFTSLGAVFDQTVENIVFAVAPAFLKISEAMFGVRVQANLLSKEQAADELERVTEKISELGNVIGKLQSAGRSRAGGGVLGIDTSADATLRTHKLAQAHQELNANVARYAELQERLNRTTDGKPAGDISALSGAGGAGSRQRDKFPDGFLNKKVTDMMAEAQKAAAAAGVEDGSTVVGSLLFGHKSLQREATQSKAIVTDYARAARENFVSIVGDGINNMFDSVNDGFKGMLATAISTFRRMASHAGSARIGESLFGGAGGGGFLGSLFGPLFGSRDFGGPGQAGAAYQTLAPRGGYEVFVPDQAGRFYTGEQLRAANQAGAPQVSIGGPVLNLTVSGDVSSERVMQLEARVAEQGRRMSIGMEAAVRKAVAEVFEMRKRRRL
jgi:hypothetical protein